MTHDTIPNVVVSKKPGRAPQDHLSDGRLSHRGGCFTVIIEELLLLTKVADDFLSKV